MVSSQLLGVTNTKSSKTFNKRTLLPMVPPDVVPTANEEFDFSDVFGPVPSQTSIELNIIGCEDSLPNISEDMVYDEPEVISNRSHSLVGPSSLIPDSPRPRKHTLDENVLELVEQPDENEVVSVPKISEKIASVGLEDFDFLKVVGQGAFGKVFQVMKKGTSDIYAMKVVRKDKIIEKNHFEYMKAERDILTKVDHPFIVQLRYSFQTKYRLYLVLDFVNGGHLFFQLYNQGLFREDLACIYAAEIVSAVSHLHANGIMHRDLKPENILLDADGHVMLTDFGLAKEFEENTRSNSMCGTVEYMAPEIIQGKGHNKSADWWSIGILLFEMLTGKPPFAGGNRSKIQQKIVKEKLKLPKYLTSEAHSLLKGLLNKDASKRLGSGASGSDEIKSHKWFKSINWKRLEAREINPCFRPKVAGKICVANFEERWTSMPLTVSPVASPAAGSCDFPGFSYVKPSEFLHKPSPLG